MNLVEDMNFNALCDKLESVGFHIWDGYPGHSMQLMGVLPTGQLFYFKAEGTGGDITIWQDDLESDPVIFVWRDDPRAWHAEFEVEEVESGRPFDWVSDYNEVERHLYLLLAMYDMEADELLPMSPSRMIQYRDAVMMDLVS